MNTVEVLDLNAYITAGPLGERPLETHADLIAAAAEIGEVEIAEMIKIKPLSIHDMDGIEEEACRICNTPPFDVAYQVQARKDFYAENLREWGVTWDPTIRL